MTRTARRLCAFAALVCAVGALDDLVGALDAFTGGHERRIDLARVNGRALRLQARGHRGLGTRARLDEGVLGVIVVEVRNGAELAQLVSLSTAGRGSAYPGWHEWTTTALEVRSHRPVDTGIDGEAVTLAPPVRIEVRPGALRVRIAPHHPGVSPARVAGVAQAGALRRLFATAFGP